MFESFIGVNFWTALFVLLNTLAVFFVAKKLCSMWDEHKWVIESKKKNSAQQKNIVVEESAKITDADQVRFCRKCGEKLIDNSRFCRKCGTEVVI